MEEEALGPNGGVMYAVEELEGNWEWLREGLEGLGGEFCFLLGFFLISFLRGRGEGRGGDLEKYADELVGVW